ELARRTRRAALPWQLGFQAAQPDEPRSSSSAPPPAAGSREAGQVGGRPAAVRPPRFLASPLIQAGRPRLRSAEPAAHAAADMSFLFGSRSSKTFKPKKNIPEGSHQYELLKHAEATLGSGNLRMAVMLPEGEDLNEWVAVNSVPFPKNFMSVAKTILKRLFRVYAHIYHQHFDPVIQLQEEAHLNTSFKHFIFFVQEFNLIDRRELAPLQELIEKLTSKDR
ncbi:MOB kinase activator 1B, partial [Lemmus lemmus]